MQWLFNKAQFNRKKRLCWLVDLTMLSVVTGKGCPGNTFDLTFSAIVYSIFPLSIWINSKTLHYILPTIDDIIEYINICPLPATFYTYRARLQSDSLWCTFWTFNCVLNMAYEFIFNIRNMLMWMLNLTALVIYIQLLEEEFCAKLWGVVIYIQYMEDILLDAILGSISDMNSLVGEIPWKH